MNRVLIHPQPSDGGSPSLDGLNKPPNSPGDLSLSATADSTATTSTPSIDPTVPSSPTISSASIVAVSPDPSTARHSRASSLFIHAMTPRTPMRGDDASPSASPNMPNGSIRADLPMHPMHVAGHMHARTPSFIGGSSSPLFTATSLMADDAALPKPEAGVKSTPRRPAARSMEFSVHGQPPSPNSASSLPMPFSSPIAKDSGGSLPPLSTPPHHHGHHKTEFMGFSPKPPLSSRLHAAGPKIHRIPTSPTGQLAYPTASSQAGGTPVPFSAAAIAALAASVNPAPLLANAPPSLSTHPNGVTPTPPMASPSSASPRIGFHHSRPAFINTNVPSPHGVNANANFGSPHTPSNPVGQPRDSTPPGQDLTPTRSHAAGDSALPPLSTTMSRSKSTESNPSTPKSHTQPQSVGSPGMGSPGTGNVAYDSETEDDGIDVGDDTLAALPVHRHKRNNSAYRLFNSANGNATDTSSQSSSSPRSLSPATTSKSPYGGAAAPPPHPYGATGDKGDALALGAATVEVSSRGEWKVSPQMQQLLNSYATGPPPRKSPMARRSHTIEVGAGGAGSPHASGFAAVVAATSALSPRPPITPSTNSSSSSSSNGSPSATSAGMSESDMDADVRRRLRVSIASSSDETNIGSPRTHIRRSSESMSSNATSGAGALASGVTPRSRRNQRRTGTMGGPLPSYVSAQLAAGQTRDQSLSINLGSFTLPNPSTARLCTVENCGCPSSTSRNGLYCLRHMWRTVVPATPTRTNEKQWKVAFEMLTSEKTYCQSLLYARNACVRLKNKVKLGKPLLEIREIDMVFHNIEDLYDLSTHLVQDLEDLHSKDLMVEFIGPTMLHYASQLRTFQGYIENYDNAVKSLNTLRLTKPTFDFEVKLNEMCDGQSLASILIMPVQRLPRYMLLLKELAKQIEKDKSGPDGASHAKSPLLDDIDAAHDQIKWLADTINSRLHKNELTAEVQRVEDSLEKDARWLQLVIPGRFLVKSGLLKKRYGQESRQLAKSTHYHFFLFNDLLLYCSISRKRASLNLKDLKIENSRRYKVKHAYPLAEINVEASPGPSSRNKDIMIFSSGKNFAVACNDTDERDDWLRQMQKYIPLAKRDRQYQEQMMTP